MDRNSAIGLTLIAVLLLGYFYWFSPTPDPAAQKPVTQSQEPLPQDNPQTPPVASRRQHSRSNLWFVVIRL